MASIDLNDVDTRTLSVTITGASGTETVEVCFVTKGTSTESAYTTIQPTSGVANSYDLPLGTAISLTTLGAGAYLPRVRVTDGVNVIHVTGSIPLEIRDEGV